MTKLNSEGPRMLQRFLAYAESKGTDLGPHARPDVELNPFERDVQAQLTAAGIPLILSTGHRAIGLISQLSIQNDRDRWCLPLRPMVPPTTRRRRRGTETACARTTLNASAGPFTASGLRSGSTTVSERLSVLWRPTGWLWTSTISRLKW